MGVKPSRQLHLEGSSRTFSLADARQRAVLDDISLTVNPGEFVSIIGPSGCGKSTLFNIIAGLDSPTSGTVGIDGEVASRSEERRVGIESRSCCCRKDAAITIDI